MQTLASRPAPTDVVVDPRQQPAPWGRGGFELLVTLITPLAALGALVVLGISPAVAVCSVLVSTFTVTTVMDIRWPRTTRNRSLIP